MISTAAALPIQSGQVLADDYQWVEKMKKRNTKIFVGRKLGRGPTST